MLIRFGVENFRSIHDEIDLSLVASDKERDVARHQDGFEHDLLTVVGIFGANGSGKSNVLEALKWLADGVRRSLLAWDEAIPVTPFAFTAEPESTYFSLEYLIDGVRFEYELEVTSDRVEYEALFHYPKNRRRRLFERAGNELTLQEGLGALSGARKLLTDRSLMLSIARRFEEPLTRSFALAVLGFQALGLPRRRSNFKSMNSYGSGLSINRRVRLFDPPLQDEEVLAADPNLARLHERAERERLQGLALLRMADLGIKDVQTVQDEDAEARGLPASMTRRTEFIHQSENGEYSLDLSEESAGTLTWYKLIEPVLVALRRGDVLVFDEIDASLHPKLSAELLSLFAGKETNPRGAQLIFSSHDPTLLTRLGRDQIWLTEKGVSGATTLTPLTTFGGDKVRQSQNLQKAYLEGRFGGIPDVDLIGVYDALGVI